MGETTGRKEYGAFSGKTTGIFSGVFHGYSQVMPQVGVKGHSQVKLQVGVRDILR